MLLVMLTYSQVVLADQVTLKSTSSPIELSGELKSFDNEVYVIETDLGVLEVDARTVTCAGSACPSIINLASEFTILGNQTVINNLLVPLLESYSYSLDADIETAIETTTRSSIKITANDGKEFAKISVRPQAEPNLPSTLKITSGTPGDLSKSTNSTNKLPIAADALVAITSGVNPVKSISLNTLHGVLSGAIKNWKEIGGPDAKINVYLPRKSSDLSKVANDLGFDFYNTIDAERFEDLDTLSKAAANDPYGLGFTSFANRRTAKALPIFESCGAYMQANAFNISSGNYPTTFYYYLEAMPETLPIFAREFLDYMGEAQAKSMIDRQGYTSLSIHENNLDNQGNRIVHALLNDTNLINNSDFNSLLQTLNGARQLSTVLRFDETGIGLNPQSSIVLEALISDLLLGNYADQTLIIAGFTDSKRSAAESKRISKSSAAIVSNLIKSADSDALFSDLRIEVMGYGNVSPIACEDTPEGVNANNRVEIWVKDSL
jgi:phosphate transport system substrate-binding protein